MKKYIFIVFVLLSIKTFSQSNCNMRTEHIIEEKSIVALIVKNNALDSIVNIVEDNFLSARNSQLWQIVELNIVQKEEIIFFQFTGLIHLPTALKINNYKGGFYKGDRLYIVKSNNEDIYTKFFKEKKKLELCLKENIPFVMENPVWIFSYNIEDQFKLEKVLNEKVLNEI